MRVKRPFDHLYLRLSHWCILHLTGRVRSMLLILLAYLLFLALIAACLYYMLRLLPQPRIPL